MASDFELVQIVDRALAEAAAPSGIVVALPAGM
jgi:hypothetical protein